MCMVGQNCSYTIYMTIYLIKHTMYIYRMYVVLANLTHEQ